LRKNWIGKVVFQGRAVTAARFVRRDWAEVEAFARAVLVFLSGAETVSVSGPDFHVLKQLDKAAKPRAVSIQEFARDAITAAAELPRSVTLTAAAQFWTARQPACLRDVTPAAAVAGFLEAQRKKASSREVQTVYRARLEKFADECGFDSMADYSGAAVERWIYARPDMAGKTRWNLWQTVQTFTNWAARQNPAARVFLESEFARVQRPQKTVVENTGYSPADLRQMLDHCRATTARARFLAGLSIAALAGVRTSEIVVLQWDNLKRGGSSPVIQIPAICKTGRRSIPISAALESWLTIAPAHNHPDGKIVRAANPVTWSNRVSSIARACEITPRKNGLRKSCLSAWVSTAGYSMAATWAGNSETVIKRNYQTHMTPEEAQAWQTLTPDIPANVKKGQFAA
jgi:integrase